MKTEPGSEPLANARWETFCRIYAGGDSQGKYRGNAAKSYESAGYAVADVRVAASNASRLLTNADINQRVTYLAKQFWKKLDISSEELIARAAAIARFDPAELHDNEGNLKALSDVPEMTRAAIQGVEVELMIPTATEKNPNPITLATKKYKIADKNAAIRTLAQVKKLVGSDTTVNLNLGSLADRLAAARKRARERQEKP